MTDGTTEAGILSVTDPGGATPLEVSWKSDADRVRSDASQTQIEAGTQSGVLSQQHSPGVPDESRCNVPPYGDTMENFTAYIDKYSPVTRGRTAHELQIACYAKFVHADRTILDLMNIHAGGVSDADIASLSTTAIAAHWTDAAIALAHRLKQDPTDPVHWNSIPPLPSDAILTDAGHSHCSVGGFKDGREQNVYILAPPKNCDKWVGEAILLNGIGPTSEQLQQVAALQSRAANTEGRIFAIFLCFRATAQCQMYGAPRIDSLGNAHPAETFASLYECQQFVHRLGAMTSDDHGHFLLPNNMWYECRSKHVDMWEPTQ